ncbi:Piwi-domain-containing protein [Rostrohypoxylon terebratum]|nr:Piwi-domain-containing protein [Rostrohypoxylon terebratum]
MGKFPLWPEGSEKGGNSGIKGLSIYRNIPETPNAKVTKSEDAIKPDLTSGESAIPSRPSYGKYKNEENNVLWANYIELKTDPQYTLSRYSIRVEEPVGDGQKMTGKKLARLIELLLIEIQRKDKNVILATDFSQIIVSHQQMTDIKAEGKVFTVPFKNSNKYQIKVTPETDLSISELQDYLRSPTNRYADREKIIQSFNIFLNYYAKVSPDHTTVGAGRSFPLNSTKDLGGGLVAIKGYYSSIRLATSRLLANINVSWGMFHEPGPLHVTMRKRINGRWKDANQIRSLGKFLQGVRIEYCYKRGNETVCRVFRIHDLASPRDGTLDNGQRVQNPPNVWRYGAGPKAVSFWIEDRNAYVTLFDYFMTEREKKLHDEFPIVNVGSRQRPTYLLPELCTVMPGQRARTEASPDQTAKMIRLSVRASWEEVQDITENGLEAVGLSTNTNAMMGQYGISVQDKKLITVQSHVLTAPTIRFADGGKVPASHQWNLRNRCLRPPTDQRRWKCRVLCLEIYDQGVLDRLRDCYEFWGQNGVKIEDKKNDVVIDSDNLEANLREAFKNNAKEIDCMIVILQDSNKATYNLIKRLADTEYGVATVCVLADTLMKQGDPRPLSGNLALKFNLKFMNNNQSVNRESLTDIVGLDKTMVVGIDVTHSPMEGALSIAGMVASVDKDLGQWPAILRCQKNKGGEMVDQLEEMLTTRIQLWQSKNKRYPENIVVYRDGVSEGQYDLVRKEELPKLQKACQILYTKNTMPKITIVVVGKRHHTRFYKYGARGPENPPPGTIVDRGVTEAHIWDFFLQSHRPFKGTARPAHYVVVHDEIFRAKFGQGAANKLEIFTHSLCYLFGRSTGAVSICTPAYYADIACQRGRCYADSQPGMVKFEVHKRLEDTMFYI